MEEYELAVASLTTAQAVAAHGPASVEREVPLNVAAVAAPGSTPAERKVPPLVASLTTAQAAASPAPPLACLTMAQAVAAPGLAPAEREVPGQWQRWSFAAAIASAHPNFATRPRYVPNVRRSDAEPRGPRHMWGRFLRLAHGVVEKS